jgi:hypothetical protein
MNENWSLKSEVEELPATIQKHSKNQLFMQVEICECKISELLHGGDYIHTVGSITVFCMTVKLHFVLLQTEHSTARRGPVLAVARFKT